MYASLQTRGYYKKKTVKMPLFPRGKTATNVTPKYSDNVSHYQTAYYESIRHVYLSCCQQVCPCRVVALGYMVTLAVPTLIAATDVTHSTRFPYIIIMYYKHTLASFTTVFIWKFSYGSLYRNASFSG
jgi:hypothetical protein